MLKYPSLYRKLRRKNVTVCQVRIKYNGPCRARVTGHGGPKLHVMLDWVQSWIGFANSGGLVGLSIACLAWPISPILLQSLTHIHKSFFHAFNSYHRTDESSICFETCAAYPSCLLSGSNFQKYRFTHIFCLFHAPGPKQWRRFVVHVKVQGHRHGSWILRNYRVTLRLKQPM